MASKAPIVWVGVGVCAGVGMDVIPSLMSRAFEGDPMSQPVESTRILKDRFGVLSIAVMEIPSRWWDL